MMVYIAGVRAPGEISRYQGKTVLRLAGKLLGKTPVPDWIDEALAASVYYAFYVPIPLVNAPREAPREAVAVLTALVEEAGFWRVKPRTVADRIASMVAAASFIERVVRNLPRQPRGGSGGGLEDELRRAVARSLARVEEDARLAKSIQSIMYSSVPGNTSELAFEDVLETILRLARETDISRVLEKVSGIKLPARVLTRYERFTRGWSDGVEFGGDVERIHYTQLVLPEEVFYVLLAESKLLLQRRVLPLTDGPVYVLLDKSGSMTGSKIDWARAVAVALYQRSLRARRHFYARFFDALPHDLLYVGSSPRPMDALRLLEYLGTVKSGGGTDITRALATAVSDIEKGRVSKRSDIILITDGEDRLSANILSGILARVRARLHTVMIKGENETLRAVSDTYHVVRHLDDKELIEVVEGVRE